MNPGGDSLASERVPVTIPDGVEVTLRWAPVMGAVGYAVYRTPTATTGLEEWVADVTATTFTDAGAPTDPSRVPLAEGALGNWALMPSLTVERQSPGIAVAPDPEPDPEIVYLSAAGGVDAAGAGETMNSLAITVLAGCSEQGFCSDDDLAPPVDPVIDVSPMGLDFWEVASGDTATLPFTIRNIGGETLEIDSIALADPDAGFSLVTEGDSFALDPDESREVTVSFSPPGPDDEATLAVIASNDPARPEVGVQLSGRGRLPWLVITPNPHDFGSETIPCPEVELTLENIGDETGSAQCNEGFLRPGAMLHVIVVSDEPERSPEQASAWTWDFFAERFVDYVASPSLLKVSGIVDIDGCNEGSVGYDEMIAATGGEALSICGGDWSSYVADLANASLVGVYTFALSGTPVEATIEIRIDGALSTSGWIYDPSHNAIVFESLPPGAAVDVVYGLVGACD